MDCVKLNLIFMNLFEDNLGVPKSGSESVDDYLKAILELSGPAGGAATSNAIAQHLGVSAPSVTGMLQKLSAGKRPCVTYQKHHGAHLTREGRKRALRIIRRHRLVELFLCQVLGYGWDEVHEEAERLEHFISEKLEDRIARKLGNPEFDPHGDLIPGKDGTLPERKTVALGDVPPGRSVVVCSVSDRDPEILRYLEHIGLTPNRPLVVVEHGPFEGPVSVRLQDEANIRALSPRLAAALLVRMT
jgi:DtxR family Mn-dependent transcriptional regulator